MLPYPSIDPVIVALGPLQIRWYGAMYLLGFLAAYWLGRRHTRRPFATGVSRSHREQRVREPQRSP